MSWDTLSWAIFLNGVLISTTSGAIGMNHTKNGVINMGLPGIMFLGTMFSSVIGKIFLLNPYWSLPICLVIGTLVNIGLNLVYLKLLRRTKSTIIVSLISLVSFAALCLLGNWVQLYILNLNQSASMALLFKSSDFTLFTVPGVLIVGTVLMILSTILQPVLTPILDEGPRGFDKWDMIVYALSGAFACISGALYPFWFTGSWKMLLFVPVSGVLFGGLEKKLNPVIGGFIAASLIYWIGSFAAVSFGVWASNDPSLMGFILGLISAPLYPRGIIGSFRRIVEYKY